MFWNNSETLGTLPEQSGHTICSLAKTSWITLMLGWAEGGLHFLDFLHVVFVACCPCEACQMFTGKAVSLFPLYGVHGWECWLTSVCANKEGHHFLHKWLQSGTICFTKLQKWLTPVLCSESSFSSFVELCICPRLVQTRNLSIFSPCSVNFSPYNTS